MRCTEYLTTGVCALCTTYPGFLKRPLFMKIVGLFQKLKPRGTYEFLQAMVNSTSLGLDDEPMGPLQSLKHYVASKLLKDITTVVIRQATKEEMSVGDSGTVRGDRTPMVQLLTLQVNKLHSHFDIIIVLSCDVCLFFLACLID